MAKLRRVPEEVIDPSTKLEATVRFIQPYQAKKPYICPRCANTIEPGVSHYVVVPKEASDLRRHWHRYCLEGAVGQVI